MMIPDCIVTASRLDQSHRLKAAALVRAALPSYYAALPEHHADELIAAAFLNDDDEVTDAAVALDAAERPMGVVAGYPLKELAQRQRSALYHILSHLTREQTGDFVIAARSLAADIPPAAGDGYYLARIGIHPDARGTGLADRLFDHVLAQAGQCDVVLHVRTDNARAIGFYHRHAFEMESATPSYQLMRRRAA